MPRLQVSKIPSESKEQIALFQWRDLVVEKYVGIETLHSIPNQTPSKQWRFKMIREGMLGGVHDLHLPIARGKYHSLYIEMKDRDGGKGMSDKQIAWAKAMKHYGSLTVQCNGCAEAKQAIIDYYNLGEFKLCS